jgi:hypothetical protein
VIGLGTVGLDLSADEVTDPGVFVLALEGEAGLFGILLFL